MHDSALNKSLTPAGYLLPSEGLAVDLSVIVPLYNEQDNVCPLYEALTAEMDRLELEYEIVFVDDGSDDDTFQRAHALARQDQRLKIIKFRRNHGQTPAIAA